MKSYDYPIIVIGAGAGGLVIAIGAARAGKKVLLIERGTYGGDCTNFGCIPSKSLIASANAAFSAKNTNELGLDINLSINCDEALSRTRMIIQEILSHEDPKALCKLGVETMTGVATFFDPHTLIVGNKKITGKNIVIATGSHPVTPKINGLDKVPYLTNETIFDLKKIPTTLGVIGAGPIGSELAQAFSRLGAKVTLFQRGSHLLKKEEVCAQKVIEEQFKKEKIDLILNSEIIEVSKNKDKITLKLPHKEVIVDQLLVAAGRKPNVENLNLKKADIATYPNGIVVDSYGRTSQKHIFAVGDVAGRALFTHLAENEARSVLTTLLMPWPLKSRLDWTQPIPRVTYTDPEVASAGLSEFEALNKYGKNKIAVYTVSFKNLDRAITTGKTEGFVKIVTKKWSSKILGATIVAPRAGEMLPELTLAMQHNIPLRKLTSLIHPYPTYSLAIRKAADQWLSVTIFPSLLKLIGR